MFGWNSWFSQARTSCILAALLAILEWWMREGRNSSSCPDSDIVNQSNYLITFKICSECPAIFFTKNECNSWHQKWESAGITLYHHVLIPNIFYWCLVQIVSCSEKKKMARVIEYDDGKKFIRDLKTGGGGGWQRGKRGRGRRERRRRIHKLPFMQWVWETSQQQ